MKRKASLALALIFLLLTQQANAWLNGGHMTVAYIAYKKLSTPTRIRVDALLQKNHMYETWTKNISNNQKGLVAFVRAATWPDCIKSPSCAANYTSDGGDNPPGNKTDY